ncbi:MAG: hypothetical protein ABJF04_13515 [Reichenbachiella sp.]|uniref:hypothetical protein n=1 Tax=Reichenbachiella sp. TaxID=2184521 RepID=UPI0032641221
MKYIFLLLILINFNASYAQTQKDNIVNERLGNIQEKKLTKAPTEGHYYLTDDKVKLTILRIDSSLLENVVARYNLRDDLFETEGLKLLGSGVLTFSHNEEQYVRSSLVNEYFALKDQFCKVIYRGIYEFYATQEVTFMPSNYNVILDTGNRADTYVQNSTYYLFSNGELMLKSNSTKKIAKYLRSNHKSLVDFIKKRNLSGTEGDVYSMLQYIENI